MFEWIESNPETVLIIVASIVNCIFTILGYKRSGVLKYLGTFDQSILKQKETTEQANVVNSDLANLIAYHEKTAEELKKLQTANTKKE